MYNSFSPIWKNSLKAFLLLVSGAFTFILIITILPFIGSLLLPDFPLWRVIKENFALLIPLTLFSFFISPLLGFAGSILKYKRIRWLIFAGIAAYWFAVFFILLVFSNFSLLNENLFNVFILTFWGFAAYSLFSLPILIPVILLFEKWSRKDLVTFDTLQKSDKKKSYEQPLNFFSYLNHLLTLKYQKKGIEMLAPAIGESILEIGFGTGHALLSIAEKVGITGKVSGIDNSSQMCKITAAKFNNTGFASYLDILCEDATKYNFPNDTFDAIFLCFTLEIFADNEIVNILTRCNRILKKTGRIIIVSTVNEKENNIVLIYEWLHAKYPALINSRPINTNKKLLEANFEIKEENIYSLIGIPVQITNAVKKD